MSIDIDGILTSNFLSSSIPEFDDKLFARKNDHLNAVRSIPDGEVRDKGLKVYQHILNVSDPKCLTFSLVHKLIQVHFPRKKANQGNSIKADEIVQSMISLLHVMAVKHWIYLTIRSGCYHDLLLSKYRFPSEADLSDVTEKEKKGKSLKQSVNEIDPRDVLSANLFYRSIHIAHSKYGMPAKANREHLMAIGAKLETLHGKEPKYYAGGGKRSNDRILRDNLIDYVTGKSRFTRNRPNGIKKRNTTSTVTNDANVAPSDESLGETDNSGYNSATDSSIHSDDLSFLSHESDNTVIGSTPHFLQFLASPDCEEWKDTLQGSLEIDFDRIFDDNYFEYPQHVIVLPNSGEIMNGVF